MQSDAWYFLDVFLRKAIDNNLSFADFFIKRAGADHAQPLFKVVLLFEWRFFDLDFKIEALIGLAAAVGCGLVLHRLTWGGGNGELTRGTPDCVDGHVLDAFHAERRRFRLDVVTGHT